MYGRRRNEKITIGLIYLTIIGLGAVSAFEFGRGHAAEIVPIGGISANFAEPKNCTELGNTADFSRFGAQIDCRPISSGKRKRLLAHIGDQQEDMMAMRNGADEQRPSLATAKRRSKLNEKVVKAIASKAAGERFAQLNDAGNSHDAGYHDPVLGQRGKAGGGQNAGNDGFGDFSVNSGGGLPGVIIPGGNGNSGDIPGGDSPADLVTPIPGAAPIMITGLAALFGIRRRRAKKGA